MSMSPEEVLSQCVSVSALCLTSLPVLFQPPMSPQTPFLSPSPPLQTSHGGKGSVCMGVSMGGGAPSHSKGPPVQHVKTLSTSTLIHGDPVSASLGLCRAVISHQADQRTTAGSERTLTRRSPSGWQAIAHPLLTCRHALHLTAVSGAGLCLLQV